INKHNLSPEEYVILNNFYFTQIYSFSSRLIAGHTVSNFLADLNAWMKRSHLYKHGVYANGGNVAFLAHENFQEGFPTVLQFSHDYTRNRRAFVPGGMILFVRNRCTNEVRAFSICPNPVHSAGVFPPDSNFHLTLEGGVDLNEAIAKAAHENPPA